VEKKSGCIKHPAPRTQLKFSR